MDYFKEIAEQKITKVHPGEIKALDLVEIIKEYYEMGYREFKLMAFKDPVVGMSYKMSAKGDKDKILKKVRSWYPDLIGE